MGRGTVWIRNKLRYVRIRKNAYKHNCEYSKGKLKQAKQLQDSKGGQHSTYVYASWLQNKNKIGHFYLLDNNKSGYNRKQNTLAKI